MANNFDMSRFDGHSPGPWTYGSSCIGSCADRFYVLDGPTIDSENRLPHSAADACLMAAAPTLKDFIRDFQRVVADAESLNLVSKDAIEAFVRLQKAGLV